MNFTAEQIHEIYARHVAINHTDEYANRYVPLPLEYNTPKWRWEGNDFPRIIALLEFIRYSKKYNFDIDYLASFDGPNDPERQYIKYRRVHEFSYSARPETDDLHILKTDMRFDFAMANQIIEHLYNPFIAIKNIYNILNEGGYFFANLPSNGIPHMTPAHFYTGITPTGIGVIVQSAGFEILEIGQWGNRDYLKWMIDNNTFGDMTYSETPGVNHIECPIYTWILARKTSEK